jgi:hypothetical protein
MPETYIPDSLFGGSAMPIVADSMIIAAGQNLKRGAVLGQITASGKGKLVNSANTGAAADGSETIYAILAEDVNATTDKTAAVYLTGEFNENALTFGGADTSTTHKTAARKVGIFFKSVVKGGQ